MELTKLTLEELWQLFPIILTPPNPLWDEWYTEERTLLASFLPEYAVLTHIGSTAIHGIWAKPIIDILIEIPSGGDMSAIKTALEERGYICMSQGSTRISFNKGYTPQGFAEKVFHLHLRYAGDNDEIAFRDYLNAHPDKAKEYEQLKLALWKSFEHDRDAYTEAKGEFVRQCTAAAKKEQG